jgi:predicted alpha/beta hydrolase family esterase
MKNAIIVHGIDETKNELLEQPNSPSNSHWLPWLQWQLIKNGILCQTPEMPNPYIADMNYDDWAEVFTRNNIDKNTILIGHSAGAGIFLMGLIWIKI